MFEPKKAGAETSRGITSSDISVQTRERGNADIHGVTMEKRRMNSAIYIINAYTAIQNIKYKREMHYILILDLPSPPHLAGLSQFRPPIALPTDLSHITTELWEIPVLWMAH